MNTYIKPKKQKEIPGIWEDKILYWAYRGKFKPRTEPPTVKRIKYTEMPNLGMKLATSVFDDDIETEINRCELAMFIERNNLHKSLSDL